MKISKPLAIIIGLAVLALIAFSVAVSTCNKIPPDTSKDKVDSIERATRKREDSLRAVIDSVTRTESDARENANFFYTQAQDAKQLAAKYKDAFNKAKSAIPVDTFIHRANCDTAIKYAELYVGQQDSVIKKQDSTIVHLSRQVIALTRKNDAVTASREGFKNDFMKLNVNVVEPMRIELKHEKSEHAQNRFWKKFFAGTTAVLAGHALIDLIKK